MARKVKHRCPACWGSGRNDNASGECPTCQGRGEVETEIEQR